MNRDRISLQAVPLIFILTIIISACGSKPTGTPASTEPTGTVLALVGPNGGHVLNMAQLKALPATEGQGGIKSSTGQITIPAAHFFLPRRW